MNTYSVIKKNGFYFYMFNHLTPTWVENPGDAKLFSNQEQATQFIKDNKPLIKDCSIKHYTEL